MIVVDTSAIIAILYREPEQDALIQVLARNRASISAGSLIETRRVVGSRTPGLRSALDRLIVRSEIAVAPVDSAQVDLADEGNARFGKGRGSPPAVLNFGDLFAYALARQLDAPLLYKGDDFALTDVRSALAPTRPSP